MTAQCYHVKQKLNEIAQAFPSLKIAEIPAWIHYVEGIRGCPCPIPQPLKKSGPENPLQMSNSKTAGKQAHCLVEFAGVGEPKSAQFAELSSRYSSNDFGSSIKHKQDFS